MAFPNIKTDEPKGSDRVSTIDDRERETRGWLVQSLEEISGYPDCPFIKIGTWNSASRPINPAANVFGYNTQTKRLEYYTGSEWEALQVDATNIKVDSATHADTADDATKATKDGDNNTISSTYLKKSGGTMAGNIIVASSAPRVVGKITGLTIGTNPDSNITRNVLCIFDNDGNFLSAINKEVKPDGTSTTSLVDYDHQDGTQHYIGVGHTSSGAVTTYAPTPASTSNDTTIATTAFVKSIFDQTKDWVVEKSIGADGYIKFNSGLILQWVSMAQATRDTSSTTHARNKNLPKPLSSGVYYYSGYNSPLSGYFSGGGTGGYQLSCDNNKVYQTLIGTQDGESYSVHYPYYYPAFKIFVIGK